MKTLLGSWLWITIFQGALGLYFTEESYHGEIPASFPPRKNILKVYALEAPNASSIRYNISWITYCGFEEGFPSDLFNVDLDTGWLSLTRSVDPTRDLKDGTDTCYTIQIVAKSRVQEISVKADIILLAAESRPCARFEDLQEKVCFKQESTEQSRYTFKLEENSNPLRFGVISSHSVQLCDGFHRFYTVIPDLSENENTLQVDNETSELLLTKSLDRETTESLKFTIVCNLLWREGNATINKPLVIKVLDVDDNGPVTNVFGSVSSVEQLEIKDMNKTKSGTQLKTYYVFDRDLVEPNHYEIKIANDLKDQFKINLDGLDVKTLRTRIGPRRRRTYKRKRGFTVPKSSLVSVEVQWKRDLVIDAPEYSFDVVFNDTGNANYLNREAVFHVKLGLPFNQPDDRNTNVSRSLDWLETSYHTDVFRHSNSYSRILTLYSNGSDDKHWNFTINSTTLPSAFNITPSSGILYVSNASVLNDSRQDFAVVQILVVSHRADVHNITTVNISIKGEVGSDCDAPCSIHKYAEDCNQSCGYGSPTGRCSMVQQGSSSNDTMRTIPVYQTCTAHPETCPDGHCDELEMMFPFICFQDCTVEDIIGSGKNNENPKRGIDFATGTCHCAIDGLCKCWKYGNKTIPASYKISTTNDVEKDIATTTDPQGTRTHVYSGKALTNDFCGTLCEAGIALGVGGSIIFALVAFISCRLHQRNRKREGKLKQFGSFISVTALPSDYVGNERRSSNVSIHSSLDWTPIVMPKGMYDPKWEFPREDIILEKTLGEGEFGRVLKAQALNYGGKRGYLTVAVKMLKSCATNAEFRDLYSEYQLLKDVHHPNVIKLLGACTEKGPFYIMVEYCEYGALKTYLRKSRQSEAIYIADSVPNPPESDDYQEDNVITSRDLLSFSWQIAKGMNYLAQTKVVHRDLAARNVLVAAGKVVKISDFGLSRDIYEEETYMKRSKSRIPVKWMAPESLYDHIYTTKSDVWSYGIVLWEIVTLGATPYPGIPPERVYLLLKTGFRMENPGSCSDELYEVMRRCWHEEAIQRPHFGELAEIFDKMLQNKAEYLDLSSAIERNPIIDDHDGDAEQPRLADDADDIPEPVYGSINVIAMDDNAYLKPYSNGRETRYLPLMIEENEESKPFLNQIKSTSEDLESTSLLEEEEFINFLHHERIHESDLDSLKSTRV